MKLKFFVHAINNAAYWELKGQKTITKSSTFETRMKAIDNLEEEILYTLSLPIDSTDTRSLVLFKIREIEDGWLWSATSTFNGETVDVNKMYADSYIEAKEDAEQFRNTIMSSPIVDFAGVPIPNMHFSREFSDKFNIGDMHTSFRKLKR